MIAYYAVANALRTKTRLIWTNPIKALSNQVIFSNILELIILSLHVSKAFANLRQKFDPEEFERSKANFHPDIPPG